MAVAAFEHVSVSVPVALFEYGPGFVRMLVTGIVVSTMTVSWSGVAAFVIVAASVALGTEFFDVTAPAVLELDLALATAHTLNAYVPSARLSM